MKRKVIACLPVYNAEKFIEKTLQGLKAQSYPNLEVLISDDCSTDNTVSVIKSFIKNDERFSLIQQEENLGWVDHVNHLLAKAVEMGDYIFIHPHDDQLEIDYVQKLIMALESEPSAVLAYSDMRCGKNILSYSNSFGDDQKIERVKKILRREGWWWVTYRGIVRASAAKKVIPLKKNLIGEKEYSIDWIWLIKLSLYGEIIRVPEILYEKYFLDNNLSYKLRSTNRNYLGNLVNGSITLIRSPLRISEQVIFQFTLWILIVKRLVIMSGLYSVFKKVRSLRFNS